MSQSDHRPTSDRARKARAIAAYDANRTPLAPYFMLALALIGIADALYDSYVLYTGRRLWCPPPIDGCNIVADSPYARILGLPLGYFGLVYYLYMFGLAALLAFDPLSRGLRLGSLVYSAMGVSFSIYFMYIQLTFIHAFCIYCLISAVLTLLLFVAALWQFRAIRMHPAMAARKERIDPGQGIPLLGPHQSKKQSVRCY